MYTVRCTCLDVAFAQNITSQFQQNPGEEHWTAIKNILNDAGYLTDADDLKSQTGYVFILNGGAVNWKSTKQSIFATSSTDAEYIAAFDASKEAVWIRKFISGLGIVPTIEEPISMYCDNTGAIAIAKDDGVTKGARHFRSKVHYLCDTIKMGDVKIEKVDTDDNLADPFTKALAFPKHSELARNIGMSPASSFMHNAVNTGRSYTRQVNVVKGKPQHDDKGFVDEEAQGTYLEQYISLIFQEFDEVLCCNLEEVTYGGRITGTSEENSQDCIVMPIWKDTSYFDSPTKDVDNGEPKTTDDAQKQVEDGPNNENAEQERFVDDSSTKDVNAAGQHINTASPDVNTGSLKLNAVGPSVNTASPNDRESTEEEPDIKSTVQTRRMSKSTSEQQFLSDIKEGPLEQNGLQKQERLKGINKELKQCLWYSRDSPFELVAYTDSDYAGVTQDRKSTTRGYQFLGKRLISWQCKKQTMVATSTTEAEYVVAASCCGQVLWIQNQLLDNGYNFMNIAINIDNNNLLTKGFDAGRFQYLVLSISKEVGTPRYLSLVAPLTKVGDEAVHKELGDRMERDATTASSLEAEEDSDTILGDVNAQTRFAITSKQSIDPPLSRDYTLGSGEDINAVRLKLVMSIFVSAVKRMLMLPVQVSALEGDSINTLIKVNPVIYTSCIEQFWATAKVQTVNEVRHLQALVDKKRVIVIESSIRRDLHLNDAEGTDCLPTATIFEELAHIGIDNLGNNCNDMSE
ncbi:hypothetical protein Tco_0708941 [Tanacetum coccineum]